MRRRQDPDGLPPLSQLPCLLAALRRVLSLFDDPEALGFGQRARARQEPAKREGNLGRVAEPLSHHRGLQGQDWRAVDANWG